MNGYMWFAVAGFAVSLLSLLYHLVRLIRFGDPEDYSKPLGDTGKAIRYSFTGAMNPMKKESAYLHIPTYAAGIIYHIGTFVSAMFFFMFLFRIEPSGFFRWVIIYLITASFVSGLAILMKRIISKKLRDLSNPDDYLSNILVTLFQFMTAMALYNPLTFPTYFITVGILLFYLPLGKLRHAVYFFAARYHLGFFYGWRGTWPPNNKS